MVIDGATRVVGVFGDPIHHTASPQMHNAAFQHLGMNWCYLAFHVNPANLEAALRGMKEMNFVGVNLTVPHKVFALALVDRIDPLARRLGAVNTVVARNAKTGRSAGTRLVGYNTDGHGLVMALWENFRFRLKGKRVAVVGAGGAGRAAAMQCAMEGASELVLANRTISKAVELGRQLRNDFPRLRVVVGLAPSTEGDLLINATSVGLQEDDPAPVARNQLRGFSHVFDMVYRPVETRLLRDAGRAGCRTANGLGMLLHQGAKAFEIWTGKKAPVRVMREALTRAVYGGKR